MRWKLLIIRFGNRNYNDIFPWMEKLIQGGIFVKDIWE